MKSSRRRYIWWLITVLIALVGLGLLAGVLLVRSSFPTHAGTLKVPGLDQPVDVYRDARGVPHVYASSEHDLFMAQGFVHAQDRFWQMDFNRHIGSGRLAEMFGAARVDTDRFLRTLGWERVARQELEVLDPDVLEILQTYSDGVNAYLQTHSGTALSLEYAFLGLLSPDYQVKPWEPIDTLVWAKVMAWDLSGNMDGEITRSLLLADLNAEQLADLYPEYPRDHPTIVTGTGPGAVSACSYEDTLLVSDPARDALAQVSHQLASAQSVLGANTPDLGSNSWVVTGSRSATGNAYLANDTHLGIQMPSIWYENALHCGESNPDCRFNLAGFSFPGVPGVVLGHNSQIAWGLTNLGPDVQDLYVERINPQDPLQYERDGEWVDMQVVREEIEIAGSDPVPLEVRYTVHGPIISDTYGPLGEFQSGAGLSIPDEMAVAVSWTALEPSTVLQALLEMNLASDWNSFRAAVRLFDVPSQNLVFADREGNIGYQSPGRIPIRGQGQGCLPSPGWDSSYDWQGYLAFDDLPSVFNPSEEYIVTANNAVIGDQYSFDLSPGWDYGYRASRIVEMLEGSQDIGPSQIQAMHGDNFNAAAETLVPSMLDLLEADLKEADVFELLRDWDYQDHMESGAAAVFNAFWRHLVLDTFGDQLPDGPIPASSRAFLIFERIVNEPENVWWDDVSTSEPEQMHDIYRSALADGLQELRAELGNQPAGWQWGDLHTATFRNQSLGVSGIAPLEAVFNRGPFSVSGGSSIVNATSWSISGGYSVSSLPSERLIIDMSDFDEALAMHTTGQSGHAFNAHYIDMANPWRLIEYDPLPWSLQSVVDQAAAHLQLEP